MQRLSCDPREKYLALEGDPSHGDLSPARLSVAGGAGSAPWLLSTAAIHFLVGIVAAGARAPFPSRPHTWRKASVRVVGTVTAQLNLRVCIFSALLSVFAMHLFTWPDNRDSGKLRPHTGQGMLLPYTVKLVLLLRIPSMFMQPFLPDLPSLLRTATGEYYQFARPSKCAKTASNRAGESGASTV
jgi:hypothetical protein